MNIYQIGGILSSRHHVFFKIIKYVPESERLCESISKLRVTLEVKKTPDIRIYLEKNHKQFGVSFYKYLMRHIIFDDLAIYTISCIMNSTKIIRYAIMKNMNTDLIFICAGSCGSLEGLKCLNDNGYVFRDHIILDHKRVNICDMISFSDHLDCLKYAHEKGCILSRSCFYAAENGHLDCLIYAHENGCPIGTDVWEIAIEKRHIDCFIYAYEKYSAYYSDYPKPCVIAAKIGYIEILEYMYSKFGTTYFWNDKTKHLCEIAAENGHLNFLKYAHEHGCDWDKGVCIAAVKNGHLDCLKYAHENNCPWNKHVCEVAAKMGQVDCLKYAHKNNCPLNVGEACRIATQRGHLACFKYIHKHGGHFTKQIRGIARQNHQERFIEYLDNCPNCRHAKK
jgi:hypothetical protein